MAGLSGGISNWGHSSVGRAVALQASGRRFDPVCLHHPNSPAIMNPPGSAWPAFETSFAAEQACVMLIDIVNEGICLCACVERDTGTLDRGP